MTTRSFPKSAWINSQAQKWKLFNSSNVQLGVFEGDNDTEALEKYLLNAYPQYYTASQYLDATNQVVEVDGNKIVLRKERGKEPLTKYTPEWEELSKLISLVSKEVATLYYGRGDGGKSVIEQLTSYMKTMPLNTVEDANALMVKIWGFAVEVLKIDRDWLVKRMEDRRYK